MRFKLALVVIGGVLTFFGVQELRLSSAAKEEPQSISCAELGANGPGDNAHIVLTEFLLTNHYVYEEKESGSWTQVWVPSVPLGGEYHLQLMAHIQEHGQLMGSIPPPKDVKVIVKSKDVSSEFEYEQFANSESLQGVIVNKIDSLGSDEKEILMNSYPGVDFDTCWILEVGRQPASMMKLAGLCVGGLALIVVGGALFFVGGEDESEVAEGEVVESEEIEGETGENEQLPN